MSNLSSGREAMKDIVESRLVLLHSLKSHRFQKYWQYRNEHKQVKLSSEKPDGTVDYSMNTAFAVVDAKTAAVLKSTPQWDFIAYDEKARRYKKVREIFWNYVWGASCTDKEIYKIVKDAMKYGTGFGVETVVCEKREVEEPKMEEDGTISFEKKVITDYEGCKLSHISWDRVYLNWANVDETSEAVVIDYYDRNDFLSKFSKSPMYSGVSEENIPKGKYYYVSQGQNELNIMGNPASTDRKDSTVQNEDTVSVLRYWNKYKDQYVVLANGVWINPLPGDKVSPIPSPSKDIPIVVYTDHYLEDDIYGLGEYDITARSRALKDEARSMSIEVVKAQAGIITIDPDSEFDDAVMELGMRKYARVEKDAFGFFAPNINAQTITYIENKADEDIIIETGVDFRSIYSTSSETAEKTKGRIEAQRERTALNVKYNAFTFYERLAKLRLSNMEFYYRDKAYKIPSKGMEVSDDGSVDYVGGGYGLFTMKPEYFAGKLALLPRIDSMVGDTSEEVRRRYLDMLQILINIKDKGTGGAKYDPSVIIEAGRGIIDDVIDLDRINEKKKTAKSPEQILKESGADAMNPMMSTPEMAAAVPPEQQSGRALILPSSAKWG